MNYLETVEYLFNSTPVFEKIGAGAYKEGLSNTHLLDEHFGHPHQNFKTIHIAGTNGKGSCSHTLASILQEQGYRVGLYTSPHLIDFRERIRINGQCISEDYVINFVAEHSNFFEPLHPSFFELTTAMAFKYFADQKVDIAVIEVGLGGRLDCTNIITPILSIITNISKDHTQFLGNTLAQIATEKAGIIKKSTPVVIGESIPETKTVFENIAKEKNAPIIFSEDNIQFDDYNFPINGGIDYITKDYGSIHSELSGAYQIKNTNTILNAIHILEDQGLIKNKSAINSGFAKVCKNTGLMGRWQELQKKPLVICDTGHNPGGWQYLSTQIKNQKNKVKRIVFGMVDDKDVDTVMEMLPQEAIYYWTQCSSHRAIPVEKLADIAKTHHLSGKCYSSVVQAYNSVLEDADNEDFIFIGGSSYVVADLLCYLQQKK